VCVEYVETLLIRMKVSILNCTAQCECRKTVDWKRYSRRVKDMVWRVGGGGNMVVTFRV